MSDYLIYSAPQGSEAWHEARAGVITASMFSTVCKKVNGLTTQQQTYVNAIRSGKTEAQARDDAGYKAAPRAEVVSQAINGEAVGEWSEAALNYAFRLAVERISGKALDEGFETWAMRRGSELEPEARLLHEMKSALLVDEVGFVATSDGLFGASADGIASDGAGCEYKCFIAPDKLRAFWFDFDATEIMHQIQGGMWITGLKKWHVGVYCPDLKPANKELWLKTFDRDDDFIETMESTLIEFNDLVESYKSRLLKN